LGKLAKVPRVISNSYRYQEAGDNNNNSLVSLMCVHFSTVIDFDKVLMQDNIPVRKIGRDNFTFPFVHILLASLTYQSSSAAGRLKP